MADAPWADAPQAPPLEFRPLAPSLPLARPETSKCVQWALPFRLFQDPAPPLSPTASEGLGRSPSTKIATEAPPEDFTHSYF
jgi:hypothetical protein